MSDFKLSEFSARVLKAVGDQFEDQKPIRVTLFVIFEFLQAIAIMTSGVQDEKLRNVLQEKLAQGPRPLRDIFQAVLEALHKEFPPFMISMLEVLFKGLGNLAEVTPTDIDDAIYAILVDLLEPEAATSV